MLLHLIRFICLFLINSMFSFPSLGANQVASEGSAAAHTTAVFAQARTIILLDTKAAHVPLEGNSEYWLEHEGKIDVQSIHDAYTNSRLNNSLFRPTKSSTRYPIANGALWIRFQTHATESEVQWFLSIDFTNLGQATLYTQDDKQQWKSQQAGDTIARKDWTHPGRLPTFRIDTPQAQSTVHYLRISNPQMPFSAPMHIERDRDLLQKSELEHFFIGAFISLMCLLVSSALAMGFGMRDSLFVYFAAFVGILGLAVAAHIGITAEYALTGLKNWSNTLCTSLAILASMSGLLFARQTLRPRQVSSVLDAGYWILFTAQGLVLAAMLQNPARLTFSISNGFIVLTLLYIQLTILLVFQRKIIDLGMLSLGFSFVLLGLTPYLLRNFGLYPNDFISIYGILIGSALSLPIILYALIRRSTARRESMARAAGLPQTDPLTGLANLRALLAHMHGANMRALRSQKQYALMQVDLSNHDWFVKEHSQEMGDRALVVAAERLQRVVRDVDMVARLEKNQFVVLVESPCTPGNAAKVAAKVGAAALRPSEVLPVGASLKLNIYVALMPNEHAQRMGDDPNEHLGWMLTTVEALKKDPRQSIRTLNF